MKILLFKQDSWESKEDKTIYNDAIKNLKLSNNTAFGWYKKNIWKFIFIRCSFFIFNSKFDYTTLLS
jgi:hypothetical protein